MEIKYLWNHNAFWQIIIMHTLLEDIIKEKYRVKKIYDILYKKNSIKNTDIIKSENLWKLLNNLRLHRNNIVHYIIKKELYWQIYSWNILIKNWKISFENSILSNEWKELFGNFYQKELKIYLDDTFLDENNWKYFFSSLYFYLIKKIENLKDN